MKVLIVHQFLWSHYKAGIFNSLYTLSQQREDLEISFAQIAMYEKSRLKFGKADTSIHKYPYELMFEDVFENSSIKQRIQKTLELIEREKPDIVNLPGYYDPAMVFVLFYLKYKTNIKVIISNDSTEKDNPRVAWKEFLKKNIVKKADGFFCYGTDSANYIKKLGAEEEQILLRRNSVNNDIVRSIFEKEIEENTLKNLGFEKKKHWFVFIGRFLSIKNIETLLDAFQSLGNTNDWGLALVGDGEHKDEILKKVDSSEFLKQNTLILKGQEWFDIPKILAHTDVLVLPSYSEPWGLVVNEAMVSSKPVIVSENCGSAIDLVRDNENGFVFNPNNTKDLANKMQFFINNPEEIGKFGEKSTEIIQKYSPENVAKEMIEGFNSCMNE